MKKFSNNMLSSFSRESYIEVSNEKELPMKKFYEVKAKCGHVGRNQYYEGAFYERASGAREAAGIVRSRSRVKHDHKDAILSVKEISRDEYIAGVLEKQEQMYFKCCSKREQIAHWDEIKEYVRPETNNLNNRISKQELNKIVYIGKDKLRNPLKYIKLYPKKEFDLELIGA